MILDDLPILYSFRRCPFAMRARMGIYLAGIEVRLREVILRDKPAEMLEASPKGTVPVMILPNGEVLEESLDIMLWALERSDPDGILPAPGPAREEALALINRFDGVNDTTDPLEGSFKYHLDRYKYATRYEGADVEIERAAALKHLIDMEARLDAAYLAGPTPGLADFAIAPFVRQFASTDRGWFEALSLPRVQAWLKHFLASEPFNAIMGRYPQWHPGDVEQRLPIRERQIT
ncbi:MAG: glutathione S-transferase [Alphaproteobacteria bacterium]|nr:MAG: glutathione S-transferase [Alphaproteobacteria bacterium]